MKNVYVLLLICFCQIKANAQSILDIWQPYNVELEDSAELGNPEAEFKMGKYYFQQYCWKKEWEKNKDELYLEKSINLLKNAALKGNTDAMYSLSEIFSHSYYEKVEHEPELEDSAYYWLEKAVQENHPDALYSMYEAYKYGKRYYSVVIKKNRKRAREYLQKALENESIGAYHHMLSEYWNNDKKALKYIKSLAERNDPKGLLELGEIYREGKVVNSNIQKAVELWEKVESFDVVFGEFTRKNVFYNLADYYFSINDSVKGIEYLAKTRATGKSDYRIYTLADNKNPIALYWKAALYCPEKELFKKELKENVYFSRRYLDKDRFLTSLLQSAQQNYPLAIGKLAYYYIKLNRGNHDEGFQWAQKGSNLNDALSQYVLGLCYLWGWGTKINKELAAEWFLKSANNGCVEAQVITAYNYLKGENGIQQDTAKAIHIFEMAAEKGNVSALNELGCIYEDQGAYKKSYDCFLKAANMKDAFARFRLGLHYYYSYNNQYNDSSKSENSLSNIRKGLRFFHAADSMGNANAPSYIGEAYENGYGVQPDIQKAIEYYKKSADMGLNYSCYYLGKIYYEGKLVNKDYSEAFKYLKIAAEIKNNPIGSAMRLLAACYRYGLGTEIDKRKEVYWMEEAKKHSDEKAMRVMNNRVE